MDRLRTAARWALVHSGNPARFDHDRHGPRGGHFYYQHLLSERRARDRRRLGQLHGQVRRGRRTDPRRLLFPRQPARRARRLPFHRFVPRRRRAWVAGVVGLRQAPARRAGGRRAGRRRASGRLMALRSLSANTPGRRANWKALGLSHEDMEKPKIAVVNSSSELAICFAHLDDIARIVKDEIRAAGGVPFEVRTAAPSDFITGAAKRGSYILAGRDIIANDIEVQVEAALLDGMICLTSCDKTPPGHLMAAARLNIPTILVIGGYQQAGEIDGVPVDVEDVWSGSVGERFGAAPKFPVAEMAENAIMGPGVCAGMATANTMHSVVEALGMALPGHAPVRANSPKMQANAREAARRIVEMVHEDPKPRQIRTAGAFRNAIATVLAVSGSTNAIKHLQATAIEAGTDIDIFALWEEMADVPGLSA